jgi:membrane-bound metal-dependent hydrolase YbcI (DUF457 family)
VFIGHYALAFGAKRSAPAVSLGTLFLACQFADLLWPTLVVLGIERVEVDPGNTAVTPLDFVSYPYSHSLVMLVIWSALFALAYRTIKGWRPNAIYAVATLVFSHFVLDFVTHRPDLPITLTGSRRVGLGLWNAPVATVSIELALFLAGAATYVIVTRARDRAGSVGLWALVASLSAIYFAAIFGPPPPSSAAVAMAGHLSWLFVAWAYWVDRHRVTVVARARVTDRPR